MAAERNLPAKEDRRKYSGETVDYPFLFLVLLLLFVGLVMLYSASFAQSDYFVHCFLAVFHFCFSILC